MEKYCWQIYDKKDKLILTLRGKIVRGEEVWDNFISFYTDDKDGKSRLVAVIPKSKIGFIDADIYEED